MWSSAASRSESTSTEAEAADLRRLDISPSLLAPQRRGSDHVVGSQQGQRSPEVERVWLIIIIRAIYA